MSYINQLTLTELSLNSEAYGATSNATFSTDDNGDIILSPSTGSSVFANSNLVTPSIQFGSGGPYISTDSAGTINLNPLTSGSVYTNSGFVAPSIQFGTNGSYISTDSTGDINLNPLTSGSVYANSNLTSESLNVKGATTLGTNSTAVSNIQFGSYTFTNIQYADAGDTNYTQGSTINLPFTPTVITFGVATNSGAMPWMPGVAYEQVSIPSGAPSGTAYSFNIYLYLPNSNGNNLTDYYVSWIAIA